MSTTLGNGSLTFGDGSTLSTSTGGTGASGTWGINISGTAAAASSVAWTNVSSRPTALSQFTNNLGNYGGWGYVSNCYSAFGTGGTGPNVIALSQSGATLYISNCNCQNCICQCNCC